MNIKAKLKSNKVKVDTFLASFFDEKIRVIKDPLVKRAIKSSRDYVMSGGKRLRSALVLTGYECFKSNPNKEVFKVAVAIEMIHHYVLLTDDFEDRALMRHGVKVPSEVFASYFSKRFGIKGAKHFGDSFQVNLALILCAYAYEIFAEAKVDPVKKSRALKRLSEILYATGYGQFVDIEMGHKASATINDVLRVHDFKTAKYTIENPLQAGAILAGANDGQLKKFSKISLYLGRAFQIQDDVLGVFGTEEKLGKSVTSDIEEGKKTLLTVKAMEKGSEEQKRILRSLLGKSKVSKAGVEKVRKIMIDTGSLDYSVKYARSLAKKAQNLISKSSFRKSGKDFLHDVATYIVERDL